MADIGLYAVIIFTILAYKAAEIIAEWLCR